MNIDRRFIDLRLTIDGVVVEPVGEPFVGQQYLVAAADATGAFAGHENDLAMYTEDGAWKFYSIDKMQTELFDVNNGQIIRKEVVDGESKWVSHKFSSTQEGTEENSGAVVIPVTGMATTGTQLPETVTEGQVFVNTETNTVYVYKEGQWDAGRPITSDDRFVDAENGTIVTADEDGKVKVEPLADGELVVSKEELTLYIYDASTGTLVPIAGKEVEPPVCEPSKKVITVTHVLTEEEAQVKGFNLTEAAVLENGVFAAVGGVVQALNIDFKVENNEDNSVVSWDGLGLDDIGLEAGDVFVLTYTAEVAETSEEENA